MLALIKRTSTARTMIDTIVFQGNNINRHKQKRATPGSLQRSRSIACHPSRRYQPGTRRQWPSVACRRRHSIRTTFFTCCVFSTRERGELFRVPDAAARRHARQKKVSRQDRGRVSDVPRVAFLIKLCTRYHLKSYPRGRPGEGHNCVRQITFVCGVRLQQCP